MRDRLWESRAPKGGWARLAAAMTIGAMTLAERYGRIEGDLVATSVR